MAPENKDDESEQKKDASAGYKVCMMRHGPAVMRGSAGFADDSKRPLTPQGKKKMQAIAKGLRRLAFVPDWVVTSPLMRAAETAEIVAQSLPNRVPLDPCDALCPGGSEEELFSFLASHPNRNRVLLVGHEPDFGEMAARLLGASRNAQLTFKKGGCCLIAFNEFPPRSPGNLVWWLTPRILRKLA